MSSFVRHLLIIDPQNDFCDFPTEACPRGRDGGIVAPSLPVAGADADMMRLSALIDACGRGLGAISVTLDSHQHLDIGHPPFWRDASGAPVAPFTPVSAADLRAGRYLPRNEADRGQVQAYLDALEAAGRHAHMIWPVHCETGSWGHNIHGVLLASLNRWEVRSNINVVKIAKGENPWTEHYSALMAEVPDPADPATQLNQRLLSGLRAADAVYIAGEAGSHCVRATMEHLVANWPASGLGKLALIEDCISPVAGFEAAWAGFLNAMRRACVRVITTHEARSEIGENAV